MRLFPAIVATALATPAACQSRAPVAVGSVSQSAAHCVLASWTLLPFDTGNGFLAEIPQDTVDAIHRKNGMGIHRPPVPAGIYSGLCVCGSACRRSGRNDSRHGPPDHPD